MKEENLDRRIRKTRKVIRECLTELLKEKRIQDITVREIAEKADINRGTFYLHYKDIFDLMEQIENELLEELEEVLRRYRASDLLTNPAVVFTEVFHLVKENSGMVSILIGENGDINFVNREFIDMLARFVEEEEPESRDAAITEADIKEDIKEADIKEDP